MAKVVVTHYTDPWSVWCWAIEPQLRRLRERHAENLEYRVRLGAILETPVPADFPRMEIVRMFHAARRQSGMPLEPDLVLKKGSGTTSRAGIAATAARLVDPDRFERYLRELRYAALVQLRDVEELSVQEDVAREVGLDPAALREAIETEEATREFYADQAEARVRGVTGFPTVTFRGVGEGSGEPRVGVSQRRSGEHVETSGRRVADDLLSDLHAGGNPTRVSPGPPSQGMEVGVAGFQPTEAYEAALARATGARWVEAPAPDLRALLRRSPPLATAEIAEVYDWLEDKATTELLALETAGAVRRAEAAGGYFWTAR